MQIGTFRQDEYDRFVSAEDFLMAVRCHLHLLANRAVDQLSFDMQVEVAARMGYADHGGRRAVEHFMQVYFRHATHVGELTRILLTALEASFTKRAPDLMRLLRRRKRLKEGYKIVNNRLTYVKEKTFLKDKLNLLRIFEEALRTGYLLHPDAMRTLSANLDMIDEDLRTTPEAQRIFMDLLLKHGNPERALRRMNELGVLAAFIPEFGENCRNDAVQYVSLLHSGRTHDPMRLDPRTDRAGRTQGRVAGGQPGAERGRETGR